MNKEEAEKILTEELNRFYDLPYENLIDRVGENLAFEKQVPDGGGLYQIEISILWDSIPQDAIRIIGSIDDGGWRAFFPLTKSIIKLLSE